MGVAENIIDVPRGLDGVVVDTTHISNVDGIAGELSYRGVGVDELVEQSFSEVATLVSLGRVDTELAALLDAGVALSDADRNLIDAVSSSLHPMHVLQGVLPLLDTGGPFDQHSEQGIAFNLAAKIPEVLALQFSRETGRHMGPVSNQTYNGRFLDWIDAPRDDVSRRSFEIMQILQMEHSFNASAYAARVVASTLAPIQNTLAAGIGTLHGVLHGGADQAALETADRVGTPQRAADFVDACISNGDKVMGMGHREYRVVDPRAKYAKRLAREVTENTPHYQTFLTLEAIEARFTERMAEKNKSLYANIEFYKGVIFRVLGLPTHYFTAMFAMARVYGYIAHVLESRIDNRLIRPAARYVPAGDG